MTTTSQGMTGVIRVDGTVRRAIERDRRKNETPNKVLRRWLGIDAPGRPRRQFGRSSVIRIDAHVRGAIERARRQGETPNDVLRRQIRSGKR